MAAAAAETDAAAASWRPPPQSCRRFDMSTLSFSPLRRNWLDFEWKDKGLSSHLVNSRRGIREEPESFVIVSVTFISPFALCHHGSTFNRRWGPSDGQYLIWTTIGELFWSSEDAQFSDILNRKCRHWKWRGRIWTYLVRKYVGLKLEYIKMMNNVRDFLMYW